VSGCLILERLSVWYDEGFGGRRKGVWLLLNDTTNFGVIRVLKGRRERCLRIS